MSRKSGVAPASGRAQVKRRNPRKWTVKRQKMFLLTLTETANVSRSARAADMSLASAYNLKNRDPVFAAEWRAALEVGYSEVEMALIRQSLEGSDRVETMHEGVEKTLKYTKTVHSFNFPVAERLLTAHRDEVAAYRAERDRAAREEVTPEQALAWLADIDARLAAHEGAGD